ncbi:MAG: aromatic ring-hydroxylating dioxygenase subunit alpha [Burkholderiales bacterium]|nr:aromatic ring-hydroxylating dioxygenase subunit alpha [Burkholderiales bacterium]MDE1927216.1 aromatic ring-hydroxylating dioxygenase subunit alpha [Burkholderiales bacterium]MDE2158204.1 aromatic ring-hydroxylating dioxygenase subunit alpha [Burkholderiales bacterium]MDE2502137.1 aromatic ring-hydroxylating dioxygenase subunit alpha [Burkholderiales bacterium]
MSDLSISLEALERSRTQLSVSSYFDEGLFRSEQELIFDHAPRYLGHELAVPGVGDHLALVQEDEGRALVRNAGGIELVSNICRHRQALMLKGRGNTRNQIVCPIHRWTYDLQGKLVGAPHFDHDPCLNLRRYELQNWQGLLFENNGRSVATDLAALGAAAQLDFSGYVFERAQFHQCDYNWKTFIEIYLEDYHVGPFHPGLGGFVTCDDLHWEFGRHHSVQKVGVQKTLARAGSAAYQRWQKAVLDFRGGVPPEQGAIWLTYYPTVMVEWYPHVLVVSTLFPQSPQKTLNLVEFFYPEEIVAFEPEFVAAQQAAYMETCIEDDEIALRMDAGRRALMQRGDDEVGPYQSPMEDGMQHFHEWYRREMGLLPGGR